MIIVLIVIGYAALVVSSIVVVPPRLSERELERRIAGAHGTLSLDQLRQQSNWYLVRLRTLIVLILVALFSLIAGREFGVGGMLIVVFLTTILWHYFSRFLGAQRLARAFYRRHERWLLEHVGRLHRVWRLLFGQATPVARYRLGSVAELRELVEQSGAVLTDGQRQLVLAGVRFGQLAATDLLIAAETVVSVGADEVIGPLLLDQLFQSGQTVFPVIEGDLEHSVGVLEIKELLTLRHKQSQPARTLMVSGISRVAAESDARGALQILLRDHSQLALVTAERGGVIGVIALDQLVARAIGDDA